MLTSLGSTYSDTPRVFPMGLLLLTLFHMCQVLAPSFYLCPWDKGSLYDFVG